MEALVTIRLALPLLTCALLNAGSAFAADLSVKGSIKPVACDLTAGAFDFGTTSHGAGKDSLTSQTTELVVNCRAPTQFAIRLIDNRADMLPGYTDNDDYGLGTPDGTKLGAYKIRMTYAFDDTGVLQSLLRLPGSQEWAFVPLPRPLIPNAMYTMRAQGTGEKPEPDWLRLMRLRLVATATLAPDIDRGKELDFEGSATVEMHYL
jgi:hypothetical protein